MNTTIYIIKAKYANVKSTTYVEFNVKNNVKDPKFKVGDHVKCQNIEHSILTIGLKRFM